MKTSTNHPQIAASKASRKKRQQLEQQQRIRQLLQSFETPGQVARQSNPKGGH